LSGDDRDEYYQHDKWSDYSESDGTESAEEAEPEQCRLPSKPHKAEPKASKKASKKERRRNALHLAEEMEEDFHLSEEEEDSAEYASCSHSAWWI